MYILRALLHTFFLAKLTMTCFVFENEEWPVLGSFTLQIRTEKQFKVKLHVR